MTSKTEQEARAEVERAQVAGQLARAAVIFDALDANAEHLDHYTRYDVALETWDAMVDIDAQIPDEDLARMVVRAAAHMEEDQVVDIVDALFGEHDKTIATVDGTRLAWQPFNECVVLTYPSGGVAVAVVLERTRKVRA